MLTSPLALAFVLPSVINNPSAPHQNIESSSRAPVANKVTQRITFLKAVVNGEGEHPNNSRPRRPLNLPPLSPVDIDKLGIGSESIDAQAGKISGITEHHMVKGSQIGWCACKNAPTDMRIDLMNRIVNNTGKEGENEQGKTIEITDVGSGRLLQAYIMTDKLVCQSKHCGSDSNNKVIINLIDPFYPESICNIYSNESGYTPPQSSSLGPNPCFSEDITPVDRQVAEGYRASVIEYLQHVEALDADIEVRVVNSVHLLPSLRAESTTSSENSIHQIVLTDPGEPALSNAAHFHMVGSGSPDAIIHSERILLFFDREPINKQPSPGQPHNQPNTGVIYVKSNLYDEVDSKDQAFLKALLSPSSDTLSRVGVKALFLSHYSDAHFYEDATQSFHQLLDSMPNAKGIKLASKEIIDGEKLSEQVAQPLDQFFKESDTLLNKKLSSGYREIPFTFTE